MAAHEANVRGIAPPLYGVLAISAGLAQGLVVVTLTYLLPVHKVSVANVAIVGALWVLPAACRFIIGPLLDVSLTPVKWCVIGILATSGCILALPIVRLDTSGLPLLIAIVMVMGVVANVAGISAAAVIALTAPMEKRGAIAGWGNAGALGGTGLGGGLGLWLATHAGGLSAATFALAPLSLISAAPLLMLHLPPRTPGPSLRQQAIGLGRAIVFQAKSRGGALAMIAVTLPACLGAAAGLFPAVARDWHASANLVAGVTGVLGGLVTIPGAIIGGYLCDRFPRRPTYIAAAFVFAAGEIAMALAPRTPEAFAFFVVLSAFLQGVGYAAVNAVILDRLGAVAPATVNSFLGSLTNVPVVIGGALIGQVQTHYGSTTMLLTEAGVAIVVLTAYSAAAWLWKPEGAAEEGAATTTAT